MNTDKNDQLHNQIGRLKQKIHDLNQELVRSENQLNELEREDDLRKLKSGCLDFKANSERNGVDVNAKWCKTELGQDNTNCQDHGKLKDLEESPKTSSVDHYIVAKFSKHVTERYSRQIILDQIGVTGQEKLLNASVLIVGCGGIGSPAIQYLAACGVGTLGLVDYDTVELSNLHRQVIHTTDRIGMSKVDSARAYVNGINSNITVHMYNTLLNSSNACDIISQYDIVLDACDNAPTRYLVNDACLITGCPLVSASALGWDGQLCVYNYKDAPCYRCIYPVPPPPETVGSCGDNGVLGPVPGLMGTLQAVEAIKIILGLPVLSKLLIYDAECSTFLAVKLRMKKSNCVCSKPSELNLVDYEVFCLSKANDKTPALSLLTPADHISVRDYQDTYLARNIEHVLLDVRNKNEFDMVHLANAVQVSMNQIELMLVETCPDELTPLVKKILLSKTVFVICRRGNDSQKVVLVLSDWIRKQNAEENVKVKGEKICDHKGQSEEPWIRNIKEGYQGWCKYIDKSIPMY
uniref:Adenylyltransferase and sulfurtransferase MOCS3 homolog n=1 Tax=Cacopsylla melanoneura TaxID=428564 RepID=A0A8D8TEE2_9HEMI